MMQENDFHFHIISVEGGPDIGHQRGQLRRQVKEVSLSIMSWDRGGLSVRKETQWWVRGGCWLWCPRRQITAVGQGGRELCTCVCETGSRDEDGGDKAWGSYRACWEGIPHLAYLSLLAWGWILKWHIHTGQSTSLVQWLSKDMWSHLTNPANFLQIWLPYWGKYSLSVLGAICYHLLKGDTKKVEGKRVL